MKKNNVIVVILLGIIISGSAFYGGMQYGKAKSASTIQTRFSGMNGSQGGQFGQGGTGTRGSGARVGGGGATSGSILSMDDKSITIKLRDGGSKIVFFSTTTQIQKSTEGSISDLSIGAEVVALGSGNSDGSVTAQSIQIRPGMPIVR